ncbi:hypothetical protein B0H14DRAFT_316875 [Mycena olivaceomarginata]|nr:hypothetical protein B0H14DRAFT_316875 [Mycena olivaceomarginata]
MDGWKGGMCEEVREEIMRRMDAAVARAGGGGQRWCGEVEAVRRGIESSNDRLCQWFDLIVKNRPAADEDKSTLTTVDDIRNGMLLESNAHIVADLRQVVVLKMPNVVLGVDDIPPRHNRTLKDDVKYPEGQRYTLQWLHGSADEREVVPNNSDATFRIYTHIPKPSPMLLHYNYGAAAVKWWGHGATSHLGISNRPTMPRPSLPVPAATGPMRTRRTGAQLDSVHPETRDAEYRRVWVWAQGQRGAQEGEVMDPDEIVMFFWSQNSAAVERRKREAEDRKREEEERASRMAQWRESMIAV